MLLIKSAPTYPDAKLKMNGKEYETDIVKDPINRPATAIINHLIAEGLRLVPL